MAELTLGSLFNKQKVQFIQSQTGTVISLDCSVSETHSRESPPTQFEVESGQTVSDHIIVKPFGLEIQGIISDSPINVGVGLAVSTAVAASQPPVGIVATAAGTALTKAISGTASPSVSAYKQLLALQESKIPFNVFTTLYVYSNMWIKSMSVPRDAQNGNILLINISLVQLLLVQPNTVNLQKYSQPNLSASQANQGRQEMLQSTATQFQKGQQYLRSLIGVNE